MICDLQASYLEYMYKTVRDSVNSDLVKRSRSQIKVKRFGFSGAVFIYSNLELMKNIVEVIRKVVILLFYTQKMFFLQNT